MFNRLICLLLHGTSIDDLTVIRDHCRRLSTLKYMVFSQINDSKLEESLLCEIISANP